jgi:hypothetical protein
MSFEIPILLIVFNRPEKTQIIFDIIKKIKPNKLFISADGPRKNRNKDVDLCNQTKLIIKQIDWDCDYSFQFQEKNVGCKVNVINSIDWFFSNNEMGIILEDDCVPSKSFFSFCEELLNKYQDNEEIMQINGFNCGLNFNSYIQDSYYFSKLNHTWGWASWKRAWNKFDRNLFKYTEYKNENKIHTYYVDRQISNWMERYLDKAFNDEDNIWSSNWSFSILKENGLCITPSVNLVRNIGFDKTSTSGKAKIFEKFSRAQELEIDKLLHPKYIKFNLELDKLTFNQVIKKIDPRASKFYYLINLLRNFLR